jgi:hypothetical protein
MTPITITAVRVPRLFTALTVLAGDTCPMDCAPIRAQVWLDAHERDFGGLRIPEAVALIERAGLEARVVSASGSGMAQEQRGDRVTVWATRAGEVGSVDAG